jgi:hypothetical protein
MQNVLMTEMALSTLRITCGQRYTQTLTTLVWAGSNNLLSIALIVSLGILGSDVAEPRRII